MNLASSSDEEPAIEVTGSLTLQLFFIFKSFSVASFQCEIFPVPPENKPKDKENISGNSTKKEHPAVERISGCLMCSCFVIHIVPLNVENVTFLIGKHINSNQG